MRHPANARMEALERTLPSRRVSDARRSGHRESRGLRAARWPVAIAALASATVYLATMLAGGRHDWNNIAIACLALALTPMVSSLVLFPMRRLDFPITTGALLGAFVFNFAVAMLSAFRIPISYQGLLLAAPFAICATAYVALRLQGGEHDRVAVLPFPGAEALVRRLGPNAFLSSGDRLLDLTDRVLIDCRTHHNPEWSPLLMRLHMKGVETCPWPYFTELRFGRVELRDFDFSDVSYSPSQLVYLRLKRVFDIGIIIVAGPIFLAIGLLVAAYIFIVSGGPVLFRQRRKGYAGAEFTILKFRTMADSEETASASRNDSRILPGCHVIRRLRLDEIPQILNILRGEMSWIGPRPTEITVARRLERTVPQYRHRYAVLPGLSGWAQVSYGYAGSDEEEIEKLAYDLYYLKRLSFDLDLLIVAKTIRTIITRAGAR